MISRKISSCLTHFLFSIPLFSGFLYNGIALSAEANLDAEALYLKNCSICHGDRGNGDTRAQSGMRPPPRDFTTVEAALELTRERMIHSVTHGRQGTAMMAHKDRLSAQEIEIVVDYIRKNFMRTPDDKAVVKNEHGKQLFTRYCAVCHGDKGSSAVWAQNGLNPPPRDFTTDEARRILTRDRMIASVTNGRPGTGMMSFTTKLNAKDIEAVVDYIREAFMQVDKNNRLLPNATVKLAEAPTSSTAQLPRDSAHAAVSPQQAQQRAQQMAGVDPRAGLTPRTNPHAGPHQGGAPAFAPSNLAEADADMSMPFPNGLKGDPVEGREFFMGNCFTCHGVTGQGDGPRAHFNTPRPRNFTSENSRRILNRARLFTGIREGKVGTVMPAWGKVLSDQQIANVAEFVFQAFVQPDKYPDISGAKAGNAQSGAAENAKKKAL